MDGFIIIVCILHYALNKIGKSILVIITAMCMLFLDYKFSSLHVGHTLSLLCAMCFYQYHYTKLYIITLSLVLLIVEVLGS